jgi:hypothetical protein
MSGCRSCGELLVLSAIGVNRVRIPESQWHMVPEAVNTERRFCARLSRPPGRACHPKHVRRIMADQQRWRAVNAPHRVGLVRAGATFVNGKLVERSDDQQRAAPTTAAA